MRTRNSNFPNNSNVTIPRRRNRGRAPNIVEPELRTIVEVAPMAERTMEELLCAPTEGYGEAIVLPEINADHFEIKTNFEAWERFKEMLRACPHHGFTELTQVDTFYNGLNENDQDSLNAAAGGNLLSKTTREALNIIENKSKVRYSLEIVSKKVVTPAPVKAVEEICVTCSGPHAWYNCPNTDNNQSSVYAATGSYNQVNPQNRVSNQMAPPGFAPVQNNGQNSFPHEVKEKILELAKIPLNENCSAMLLKKFPEKLGDPVKFLIPCDFLGIDVEIPLRPQNQFFLLLPIRSLLLKDGISFWKKRRLSYKFRTSFTN
ncbi:hypothetical protein Tco_0053679 [Tanacetum coccineum]